MTPLAAHSRSNESKLNPLTFVTNSYQTLQSFENLTVTFMAVLSKLLGCCCIHTDQELSFTEKRYTTNTDSYILYKDNPSKAELADEFIAKLFAAENNDAVLQADLKSLIHAYSWYDGLAAAILAALENAIKLREEMGSAVKAAYEKAVTAVNKVKEWAEEHPKMTAVIITLIALGVLALMIPWLMAYLGFAEEGIIEGKFITCFTVSKGIGIDKCLASWAAGWQATYRGFVPKGSLFSYLQSLGTKIGRSWRG